MKIIDKLAWIYVQDKKILSTLSIWKDIWYIPWWKREWNESDQQALVREIEEELTVKLDPELMEHYWTFEAQAHWKDKGIIVKMTCYIASHIWEFQASSEIQEWKFLEYKDREISSEVDKLIFDDLHTKWLII